MSQQTRDCKHFVDDSGVDVAEDLCCQPLPPDCVSSFAQLATILMEELNLVLPNSPESAEELISSYCFDDHMPLCAIVSEVSRNWLRPHNATVMHIRSYI